VIIKVKGKLIKMIYFAKLREYNIEQIKTILKHFLEFREIFNEIQDDSKTSKSKRFYFVRDNDITR
jgi:hypothetical protein